MPRKHARPADPIPTTDERLSSSRPFRQVSPVAAPRAPGTGHSFARTAVSPPPLQALLDQQRSRGAAQALQAPGRGKPLPAPVQAKMERALGHDFSDVRIHEGPQAESLGALAYTRGTDIHFAPGRFSPASAEGQKVLGHELAHVVQQRSGRVQAPPGQGAPINADPTLEAEADRLAEAAVRGTTLPTRPRSRPTPGTTGPRSAPPVAEVIQPWAWAKRQIGKVVEAFRGWRQRRQMESDYRSLMDIRDQQHHPLMGDALLRDLLDEAEVSRGHTRFSGQRPDWGGGDTGPEGHGYKVRLERGIGDPDIRRSLLFHELTHVSSDRAYTGNPNLGENFLNVHADQDQDVINTGPQRRGEVQHVIDHLDQDHALTDEHREHIRGRLANYAVVNPIKENDTVVNELYLYSHLKGIKDTATGQRLRQLAQAGHDRRHDPLHRN